MSYSQAVIPAKAGIHLEARLRRYKERRFELNGRLTHALAIARRWIPAFAGMTTVGSYEK
ncbi:MAG: hypothetical protein P4M13_09405 [Alphaproteobacteria bacterium]|nr:hypothetical protein [Alphaproteobacteria bacterium]